MSAGFGQWRRVRATGRGSPVGLLGIASAPAHHQDPDKHGAKERRAEDDQAQAQHRADPVADRVVHAVAAAIGRIEPVDAQHDATNGGDGNGRNKHVAQDPHDDRERIRPTPAVGIEVMNAEEVAAFLRVDRKTVAPRSPVARSCESGSSASGRSTRHPPRSGAPCRARPTRAAAGAGLPKPRVAHAAPYLRNPRGARRGPSVEADVADGAQAHRRDDGLRASPGIAARDSRYVRPKTRRAPVTARRRCVGPGATS